MLAVKENAEHKYSGLMDTVVRHFDGWVDSQLDYIAF